MFDPTARFGEQPEPRSQFEGLKPGDRFTAEGPNGPFDAFIDAEGKPRRMSDNEELFGHGNDYPVERLQQQIKDRLATGEYEYTGPLPESAPEAPPELTPEEQLRQGLKGARSQYGKQKVSRSEELRQRLEEGRAAMQPIADPDEAYGALRDALRGEMPVIDFNGLTQLNEDSLKHLRRVIRENTTLLDLQKLNLDTALVKAVREKRVPRPYEMRLFEQVFNKATAMGIAQGAVNSWDVWMNILNIPRSLQSTLDFSAFLRQGLVAGSAHPLLAIQNWPKMMRAARSPKYYTELMNSIENDDLYTLALAAHVSFTDVSELATLGAHEEQIMSDYAMQIPGFGRLVKGSARAYSGYLNKMRMDLFKLQIRNATAAGRNIHDEQFLRAIGRVVNASTGRGNLPEFAEDWAPFLNAVFFSPRLMMSRINYLDPTWYVRLGRVPVEGKMFGEKADWAWQVRREALRGLFATAGFVTTSLYMFSRIPGVDVGSLDPRSADFGKLRIGNTRIDVAGGFQQYIRLAAILAPSAIGKGVRVSSTTGHRETVHWGPLSIPTYTGATKTKLGTDKFGSEDAYDVLSAFFRGKASPPLAAGINLLAGRNQVGEPVNLLTWDFYINTFVPLILQDTKKLYDEKHGGINGIEWALGGYGLGAFGLGIQTYAPKAPKARSGGDSGIGGSGGFGGGGGSFGGGGGGFGGSGGGL